MAIYEGDHSITFGDGTLIQQQFVGKNTWTDWHLIPATRPTPAMPGFNTKYVEIPGRDGTIDLSECLVKRPVYGDRSGSFQFYVDHEHYNPIETWVSVYHDIAAFLHGKHMKMCLSDDPLWYYEGRFSLNEFSPDAAFSSITINYQVQPFKYKIYTSGDTDILWDPFNFETDYDYSILINRIIPRGQSFSFTIMTDSVPVDVYIILLSGSGIGSLNGNFGKTLNQRTYLGQTHSGLNTVTLTASTTMAIAPSFREASL